MSRSLWKGPFAEIYLQKKSRIQTQSRRSVILPQYVGKEFQIYNGKHYLLVRATQDMIGADRLPCSNDKTSSLQM